MATTLYGDIDGIIDRWSLEGVELRTDDSPPTFYGRILQRASRRIDRYCLLNYTDSQLAASDWVHEVANDLGAYYLAGRRGNNPPPSIREFYEDAIADLKDIHEGRLIIPDATPRRMTAPVMSNVTMRLWPTAHTRVQKRRSTGNARDYSQRQDKLDPLQYYPGVDF